MLLFYWVSFSLNGSPQFGQNFGGLVGSSGSQPHLSQRYRGFIAGLGEPQLVQNLPVFTAPQEQVQLAFAAGAGGFFAPHSGQKLPETIAPQEHFHWSVAGAEPPA